MLNRSTNNHIMNIWFKKISNVLIIKYNKYNIFLSLFFGYICNEEFTTLMLSYYRLFSSKLTSQSILKHNLYGMGLISHHISGYNCRWTYLHFSLENRRVSIIHKLYNITYWCYLTQTNKLCRIRYIIVNYRNWGFKALSTSSEFMYSVVCGIPHSEIYFYDLNM